jgi:hypothetical protein
MIQTIQIHSGGATGLQKWAQRGHAALKQVAYRTTSKLKLRSRRGDGNMLWTVLMLALVAGVATISIVAMAPKMKSLGENAAAKVNAIPATWP